MDVGFAPLPVFGDAFSRPSTAEQQQFQAYFLDRLKLVGDVAVGFAVGRVLVAGRILSTSFKLAPATMKADTLFLPFTLFVETPGVLHLALDVGFYKGVETYKALADATARAREWLKQVDAGTLQQLLGAAAFKLLTQGNLTTSILAEVEVPPVWLNDP